MAATCFKDSGEFANSSLGTTFALIAACGQITTHLLHCVHRSASSQTGTKSAIPRFSNMAVPVGNVPSAGKALTGNSSPLPAKIVPKTSFTNSLPPGTIIGFNPRLLVTFLG